MYRAQDYPYYADWVFDRYLLYSTSRGYRPRKDMEPSSFLIIELPRIWDCFCPLQSANRSQAFGAVSILVHMIEIYYRRWWSQLESV